MTLKHWIILTFFAVAAAFAGARADDAPLPRIGASERGWTPQPGDEIRFNVLRQSNAFGSHVVRFAEAPGGGLKAQTEVSLRAGLGPVTLFRYELNAEEIWRRGELVSVTGRVNDDGKRGNVSAKRENGRLSVQGTAFSGAAPDVAVPASHWNYAQTKTRQLLSTEDGEIISVNIVPRGRETIRAAGREIEANRYLLESDINVDLWYDDEGRWVKLAFQARGQQIEYVLDRMY
ncbi:DUF6134 family protein [Hyphomonas sp.]|uniref:DUF6134 family protein n=1 Tax=Hyphomonas sp. TaxID=87 RepID=UPI00391CDEC5